MNAMASRQGTIVRVRRTFAARREDVFRAWTEADLFCQWFKAPLGSSSAQLDARAGGAFSVEMKSPVAPTVRAAGTYLEVVPPERLAFTLTWDGYPFDAGETLVTVDFRDRGEMTEVVLVHERQPGRLVHVCHSLGWRACLRRLRRRVTRPLPTTRSVNRIVKYLRGEVPVMTRQAGTKTSVARAGLISVLLAAAATLLPSSAAAANTMDATCTLSGRLDFEPPLSNELRDIAFRDHASGSCTGSLNGVPEEEAPVVLRARGSGTASCLGGHTTSSGTLTFTRGTKGDADDVKIRFFTDMTGAALQATGAFRGAISGEGIAYVTFLPYADEAAMAACETGSLGSARYDLLARTITPVVG